MARKAGDAVRARGERIVNMMVGMIIKCDVFEMSVKDIGDRINATPTQVGHAIDMLFETDQGWIRIEPTTVLVDVKERNYGSVTHQRACRGYQITRQYLAALLQEERDK